MTGELRPYPEYKESGLPRHGQVPAHWECLPLKRVVEINRRTLPETTDPDYRFDYLDIGSVATGFLRAKSSRIRFGDAPSRARRVVLHGDIIVSTVRTYLRAVYHFDTDVADLVVSTGFAVLTPPHGACSAFFGYVAQSAAFIDQVVTNSNGIAYPAIPEGRLGIIPITFPPDPEEQAAIALYLRAFDTKVRRFIRNRRRLIEVLNEEKQAIINRAVTRGLDPTVRLKPSAIDWFGEIPEHWNPMRLRHISPRIGVGLVINPSTYFIDNATTDGVPMLLGNNVVPGGFKLENVRRISIESNAKLEASRLNAGDVVVVRVGAPGVAAVVPQDLDQCNCASVVIVRQHRSFLSEWLAHSLNSSSIRAQVDAVKYGAAQKQFNVSHAVDFWFPVPPLEEQARIVEYLRRALAVPVSAIDNAQREIALIREYRTRLIADVVTGKLDVRHLAPAKPLPADEESGETIEDLEEMAENNDPELALEGADADD